MHVWRTFVMGLLCCGVVLGGARVSAQEAAKGLPIEEVTGLRGEALRQHTLAAPRLDPRFRPRGSPEVAPQPPRPRERVELERQWGGRGKEEKMKKRREQWLRRQPAEAQLRSYQEALQVSSGVGVQSSTPWQALTGSAMRDPDGVHHKAGRITSAAYAFDHSQGLRVLWLGSSSGGLWKSVYLGLLAIWAPVSSTLPGSPAVGGFVVHPNNSNRILIGTGDPWRYGGTGLYRTLDGGSTWALTSLSPIPGSFYKLALHRTTPDTVLAAADNGLWRSTDFGQSWTRVHANVTTDVVQDPRSPQYWYAGAPGVGVLESTDHGATWHPVNGNGGNGIPDPVGRVALAVSESAPNYVYAVTEGNFGVLGGIFRSSNYGYDWARIDSVDMISWGMAFQSTAIAVDPTTPDRLFVGMGGVQWTQNATAATPCWTRNVGPGCTGCSSICIDGGHADFTSFVFVPGSSSAPSTSVIATTDGGYYVYNWATNSVSGAGNRLGLNVLQVMAPGNSLAVARANGQTFLTGLQDNGMGRYLSGDFSFLGGGDGGPSSISPDNPQEYFYSSGAAYSRYYSTDQGVTWRNVNCTLGNQWTPAMLRDPTPGLAAPEVFTNTDSHIWYKRVSTACDWAQVNSTSPLPAGFAIKQIDQNNNLYSYVLYATGWGSERLYVMEGNGMGALLPQLRTPPLPTNASRNDSLATADRSSLQPQTVYYVTATARPSRAYLSTNRGVSWRDVTGDLTALAPNAHYWELVANPANLNQLFLATSVGVFRSDNGGLSWYRYMEGLPAVVDVTNIELSYDGLATPVLHIGTFGRGYWSRPLN